MAFIAMHPGINTDYRFTAETEQEAWSALKNHLIARHGGLASGMLAGSRVELVIDADPVGECLGEEYNNTRINLNQDHSVRDWQAAGDDSLEWPDDSDAYYVDQAGNPSIFVWWTEDEEEY